MSNTPIACPFPNIRINGGLANSERDEDGNVCLTPVGTTLWFNTRKEVGTGIGSPNLCYGECYLRSTVR